MICTSWNGMDTAIDDEHFKIIPLWRLLHVIEKKAISLQKYLNWWKL